MAERQSDQKLSSGDERSSTRGSVATNEESRSDPDSGLGVNRRSVLKLAGSAVVSSGLIGTAAAATTRHGITFDTVVNAVDDLGMDPNGNDPIDLGAHVQSNTLIEFPAGDYLIGNRGSTVGVTNFGMRGLGSSHKDVQFLPPKGVGQGVLAGGGEGPFLVENMSMQERDDETSALWFGLGSARGGYMGNVEWLGRTPSDNAAGSDYQINASVYDSDGTWVFENVRAGLDLPSTPEVYPDGIAFLRSGPSHQGVAIMRDCVIHERNSTATRWEAGPGVVKMERCEFVNNQLCSVRIGGGDHPTENCVIKDCYVYGDGSRDTTAPIEIENSWPNAVTLDNVTIDWDTTQGLRGVIDSPGYEPHTGPINIRNCVARNQSLDANIVRMPDGTGPVTIENSQFTGDGAGISVLTSSDSIMRDSCFDMPNGSITGIETQNISTSGCQTSGESNSAPSASITVTGTDGLTVDLSGADSSDSDGQIASYDWDVNGTTYTGSTVTHTFGSGGTYPVSLTVTDDGGATATASTEVTVNGEQYQNELKVQGTGTTTNYEFSVSDSLAEADSSLEPWDDLSGSTANGWVTSSGDVDTYEFTGEIVEFTFRQGNAAIYLDGERVSPSGL